LAVAHVAGAPDQMQCAACGSAFEVEAEGARLRLVQLPPTMASAGPALLGIWLLAQDVPAAIERSLVGLVDDGVHELPETPAAAEPEALSLPADLLDELLAAATASLSAAPRAPGPSDEPEASLSAAQLDELAAAAGVTQPTTPAPAAGQTQWAQTVRELLYGAEEAAPAMAAEAAAEMVTLAPGDEATSAAPPAELGGLAVAAAPAGQVGPRPHALDLAGASAPGHPAPVDDLAARARQLYELGNPVALIRSALERSGAAPEAVKAALAEVVALETARQRRHLRTYRWAAAAVALLLLLLMVAAALTALRPAPATAEAPTAALTPGMPVPTPTLRYNPLIAIINLVIPDNVDIANGPRPTPGPTSELFGVLFPPTATPMPATATARAATREAAAATAEAGGSGPLPDWVRDLIPDGITVINVPTPSVENTGPSEAACPVLSIDAAKLFGGEPGDWQYDSANDGWILIVVGQPITLRVPANMAVGYIVVGDTFEMRSELGPVTIHNVNFAAVSCGL
jgi:hypothetical protein